MNKVFKWIFAIFVIASVFCGVGCKPEVEIKPTEKETGTIQGKAFYSNKNVDNHSGIKITLVSTDGLRSVAYCESRGIATNARSVSDIKTTSEDGSYSVENIPVGTYTIWASSRNSVEEAIETNVNVRANEVVTANDLNLVATGNIKGAITIDGKTDGTLGLDVFIAGTPYVAKVGPTGNYEISKIPASKGYMLCVQKGEYTTIINEDLEVKAKETIEVGCKNLLSEDWAIENEVQTNPTFKWLGEFETEPEDPELYWAYYNTTDGCSYIWNGSDWDLLAKSGEDGVDGEDGKDGTDGKDGEDGKDGVDGLSIVWKGALEAAPENPELYWAYYNTTDGCSYIWNGSDWDLLAKSGEDGVDGLSIVWKGALEAAPENPELNWAYYNINTGCSYIWNGSDWDLLTQHAHTYEWTSDEKSHWYACVCGEKKDESEHNFGIWKVTTEPTATTEGTSKRVCDICNFEETKQIIPIPEGFVLVEAGTFQMGSNEGYSDNQPVHEVTITKPFYMGKYEVTQAEYEKYCSYTGNDSPDSSYGYGDNYPAYYLSWYDALVYCNKRSMAEGLTPCYSIRASTDPNDWGDVPISWNDNTWDAVECNWNANGYRLPTEAEWEYVARAGDNTVDALTYSGTSDVNELGDYAWYEDNLYSTTHEVGTKLPNAYGLYDMSGNVWEWCWNWFTASYDTEKEGGSDPTGTSAGSLRVYRGGSWNYDSDNCAVSYRGNNAPHFRYLYGFRVVRPSSN